jgi:phosphoglucosamine mutase
VRVSRRFDAPREPGVASAIARVERSLGERGRVVLRASGTEPLIRVMVEGEDAELVARHAEELAAAVRAAAPAA